MSTGVGIALVDNSGNALVDANGNMLVYQPSLGTFLFLVDHFVDDQIIQAGTEQEMFYPWIPTADVEPLDAVSTAAFYAQGPQLGQVIRTHYQQLFVRKPITYWYQISPNNYALAGLGAGFAPVYSPNLGRIEDK